MIGAVIVVHSIFPGKLLDSLAGATTPLNLYVFFHGQDADLRRRLVDMADTTPRVTLLLYGANRGLATSWNDGIRFSRQRDDEFTLILNDDLHFRPGGFDQFVAYARSVEPGFGIVTVMGLESGGSPHAGHTLAQDFACCVVGTKAIETIGYFDTSFGPAYYEDLDYLQRLKLAGLPVVVDQRVLVEHERGSTTRNNALITTTLPASLIANKAYFLKKWGGDFSGTTYDHPFDDPDYPVRVPFDAGPVFHRDGLRPGMPAAAGGRTLDAIGVTTGTEKSSTCHNFLAAYEPYLERRRHGQIRVLEIGVAAGASTRLWEEYFPAGEIVGMDNNPAAMLHRTDRVTIAIADQSDPEALLGVASKHGPFDLVVDDGSHFWDHQILSLQVLFPFLRPRGIYIIENVDTSYGNYEPLYNNGAAVSAAQYLKRLVDRVAGSSALSSVAEPDVHVAACAQLIASITFFPRACLISRNDTA